MAALAPATHAPHGDEPALAERFAFKMAVAMALTVVLGFSTQLAMGRSTFASPLRVHLHAVVFMGWVAIFLTQSYLATRGPVALHRKLGWLATGWVGLMVVLGFVVTVMMARNGTVPFFFMPQQFLIADPLTVLMFAGVTALAVANRKRTDWHARLHICGMALITAPAFGRLLPMPLLSPYAFEAAGVATLVFPLAGMIRDQRKLGRVHPAWLVGAGAIVGTILLFDLIAYSPLGGSIYHAATAGSPGASVPGLAFPAPPAGGLITGR